MGPQEVWCSMCAVAWQVVSDCTFYQLSRLTLNCVAIVLSLPVFSHGHGQLYKSTTTTALPKNLETGQKKFDKILPLDHKLTNAPLSVVFR